jgi:hypothetical protein
MKPLGTTDAVLIELGRGVIALSAVDVSEEGGPPIVGLLVLEGFDRVGHRRSVSHSASLVPKLQVQNDKQ